MVEDRDGRRGRTPRRVDLQQCYLLKTGQLLEAGAANDGNADGICIIILPVQTVVSLTHIWELRE